MVKLISVRSVREGSILEKRELLSCLRSKITMAEGEAKIVS